MHVTALQRYTAALYIATPEALDGSRTINPYLIAEFVCCLAWWSEISTCRTLPAVQKLPFLIMKFIQYPTHAAYSEYWRPSRDCWHCSPDQCLCMQLTPLYPAWLFFTVVLQSVMLRKLCLSVQSRRFLSDATLWLSYLSDLSTTIVFNFVCEAVLMGRTTGFARPSVRPSVPYWLLIKRRRNSKIDVNVPQARSDHCVKF